MYVISKKIDGEPFITQYIEEEQLEVVIESIKQNAINNNVEVDIVTMSDEEYFDHLNNKSLNQVKQEKIVEIQQACDEEVKTFKSSALGTRKTYLADEKSMAFLNAQYTFVRGVDYDGSTIDWFTIEDNDFVEHTGEQIAQVFLDGRAWIKEQKTVKLKQKLIDVETIYTNTTLTDSEKITQINAITW